MKLNQWITIILILSFFTSLFATFLATRCDKNIAEECLMEKGLPIMPEMYWHYNIIKYVANYGYTPKMVYKEGDAGPKGDLVKEEGMKTAYHSPGYYYVGALIFLFAKKLNISPIITLQVFASVIMLLTNIVFFLLVKKISKYVIRKKQFIIYSTALFAFLPIHLYISLFIHDSILFYFLFIVSLYMYVRFMENKNIKNAILFGGIVGLSLLAGQTGLMTILTILIFSSYLFIKKEYKTSKLLFISLISSLVIGVYPFIRNYIYYGYLLDQTFNIKYASSLTHLLNYFPSFWSGVYGGNENLRVFIGIIAVLLTLTTIYGFLKYKNLFKKINLNFIVLIGILTILALIHLSCNFLNIISFKCIGIFGHAKYLISLEPIIAIFSSIVFVNLRNKRYFKSIIPLLIFIICLLFSIDFISAFV